MELEVQTDKAASKKSKPSIKTKEKGTLKKLSLETAKAITQVRERANKKAFGRKVRDSEVMALAVSLITDAEIKSLQEATYSEQDRLKMAHSAYQEQNGRISLDDFIGKLLRGEISQKSGLNT